MANKASAKKAKKPAAKKSAVKVAGKLVKCKVSGGRGKKAKTVTFKLEQISRVKMSNGAVQHYLKGMRKDGKGMHKCRVSEKVAQEKSKQYKIAIKDARAAKKKVSRKGAKKAGSKKVMKKGVKKASKAKKCARGVTADGTCAKKRGPKKGSKKSKAK